MEHRIARLKISQLRPGMIRAFSNADSSQKSVNGRNFRLENLYMRYPYFFSSFALAAALFISPVCRAPVESPDAITQIHELKKNDFWGGENQKKYIKRLSDSEKLQVLSEINSNLNGLPYYEPGKGLILKIPDKDNLMSSEYNLIGDVFKILLNQSVEFIVFEHSTSPVTILSSIWGRQNGKWTKLFESPGQIVEILELKDGFKFIFVNVDSKAIAEFRNNKFIPLILVFDLSSKDVAKKFNSHPRKAAVDAISVAVLSSPEPSSFPVSKNKKSDECYIFAEDKDRSFVLIKWPESLPELKLAWASEYWKLSQFYKSRIFVLGWVESRYIKVLKQ